MHKTIKQQDRGRLVEHHEVHYLSVTSGRALQKYTQENKKLPTVLVQQCSKSRVLIQRTLQSEFFEVILFTAFRQITWYYLKNTQSQRLPSQWQKHNFHIQTKVFIPKQRRCTVKRAVTQTDAAFYDLMTEATKIYWLTHLNWNTQPRTCACRRPQWLPLLLIWTSPLGFLWASWWGNFIYESVS